MTYDFIPSNFYEKKFYQRGNDFKKFVGLSEEELSALSKRVYQMQESMFLALPQRIGINSKFEIYQMTLKHLTNPNIYFDLKTFDERVAYLILMVDPNLMMFKEFLKINLMSISEISSVDDDLQRNKLIKIRNQTMASYETSVREKVGFFDIKLLKYEECFFKRFYNEKELITEIGINTIDKLMNKVKLVKNFNCISDERFEELTYISQIWLSLVPEKYNFKIATYSVTNQYKLLGLTNVLEQLVLLILLIDGNLDMLKIYEEESTMKNIEKRIIEQFGYFDKDLLVLERKFYDRFCPTKDLSVWGKTKKR